ncbi:MAG: transposase [Phycisphaerae bacterium]|nr:transposase [Gemmatimonadaceae bacterium]
MRSCPRTATHLFMNLDHARQIIEPWRREYNEERRRNLLAD